jgi:hypothetical protein
VIADRAESAASRSLLTTFLVSATTNNLGALNLLGLLLGAVSIHSCGGISCQHNKKQQRRIYEKDHVFLDAGPAFNLNNHRFILGSLYR